MFCVWFVLRLISNLHAGNEVSEEVSAFRQQNLDVVALCDRLEREQQDNAVGQ